MSARLRVDYRKKLLIVVMTTQRASYIVKVPANYLILNEISVVGE
jgi:hypothetical protein